MKNRFIPLSILSVIGIFLAGLISEALAFIVTIASILCLIILFVEGKEND